MRRWIFERDPAAGLTFWDSAGFTIAKANGYAPYTLRMTGNVDTWPLEFKTLAEAKAAAAWPIDVLRYAQRESFAGYCGYWARITKRPFDERLIDEALKEDAFRCQRRSAA